MNKLERTGRLAEYHIPVSSQGQITLPKPVREHLGVKVGGSNRINILIRTDGVIVIEPEPTVQGLFAILKPKIAMKRANVYEVREEITNERLRELGYSPQDD